MDRSRGWKMCFAGALALTGLLVVPIACNVDRSDESKSKFVAVTSTCVPLDCNSPSTDGPSCTPGDCYNDFRCPGTGWRCGEDGATYNPDESCPALPDDGLQPSCAYPGECMFIDDHWERCDDDAGGSFEDDSCAEGVDLCQGDECSIDSDGTAYRCIDEQWEQDDSCDIGAVVTYDEEDDGILRSGARKSRPAPLLRGALTPHKAARNAHLPYAVAQRPATVPPAGGDEYCADWECARDPNDPFNRMRCDHEITDQGSDGDYTLTDRYALCNDVMEFFANFGSPFDNTSRSFGTTIVYSKWLKIHGSGNQDLDGSGYPGKLWTCNGGVENGVCKFVNPHTCGGQATMIAIRKIAPYNVRFWGRPLKPNDDKRPWQQRLPSPSELQLYQLSGTVASQLQAQGTYCTNSMNGNLLDYKLDGDANCNVSAPLNATYPYNTCIGKNTQGALFAKPFLQQGRAWGDIPEFLTNDEVTLQRAKNQGICIAGFVGLSSALLLPPAAGPGAGWITASIGLGTVSGGAALSLSCSDVFSAPNNTFNLKVPIVTGVGKQNFTPIADGNGGLPGFGSNGGFAPDVPTPTFKNGSVISSGSMMCVRDIPPMWEYQKEVTYERGTISIGFFSWSAQGGATGTRAQTNSNDPGVATDFVTRVTNDERFHIQLLEPCQIQADSIQQLQALYVGGGSDPALEAACTFDGTSAAKDLVAAACSPDAQGNCKNGSPGGYFADARQVILAWCAQTKDKLTNVRPYGTVQGIMSRTGPNGRIVMTTQDTATSCMP